MNNNRQKEIAAILVKLSEYAKTNYVDNSFYEIIYKYLRSYNIGKENNLDIRNNFLPWINRFQNKKTKCVNTSTHPYWCQFINEKYNNQVLEESDPVKLYIPLKSEYIYEGVNRIFDFCEQNNIIHQSKVASKMRNDNVVLRIKNIEDARKVINFVNNDSYLQRGALKPNAFCFNVGNVGMAIDNMQSYNDNVSKYLLNYIRQKKQQNNLNNVSLEDFFNYVACNRLQYDTKESIIYGDEIRKLILTALSSNNFEDFSNHYYSVIGNKNNKKNKSISYEKSYNVIQIINDVISVTTENHGIEHAKSALYLYLTNGNVSAFSRYKNDDLSTNYRIELSKLDYKIVLKKIIDYCGTDDLNKIISMFVKSNIR